MTVTPNPHMRRRGGMMYLPSSSLIVICIYKTPLIDNIVPQYITLNVLFYPIFLIR